VTTPFPFIVGAPLRAEELNDITNLPINDQTASYTLVVGDVGKRVVMDVASANTVTVDDSIFGVGDTIFIANKGAGVTTVTAGSGVTINSASGLELVTNQSGQLVALSASSFLFVASAGPAPTSGLELISTTTIGTAVASVTVSGAFSSTYDNYRIIVSGGAGSTNDRLKMTVGATTTGYYNGVLGHSYAGSGASAAVSNGAAWDFVGYFNTDGIVLDSHILSPNLAKNTFIGGVYGQNITTGAVFMLGGYVANTTQYTAFTITPNAGTLTGGTIRVYGYANS
jgi:hypothetical protein